MIPNLTTLSGPLRVRGLMPQGINTPMLIEDGTGRLWVRKDVGISDMPSHGLLGELLGWSLGQQIGVPMPDAAIWQGPRDEVAWMSAYLDGMLAWDPALTSRYAVADMGAILAFDVAMLNRDRNTGNLLVEPALDHPMRVWAIDHERLGVAELRFLRTHQHTCLHELPHFDLTKSQPRGLPLDDVEDAAMAASKRLSSLSVDTIDNIVRECLSISGYIQRWVYQKKSADERS